MENISRQGFDSDLYVNFDAGDFAKKIAIVPVSAATGTGVPELLTILMGLAQQYLEKKLVVDSGMPAKGTILEVKGERGLGQTIWSRFHARPSHSHLQLSSCCIFI